MDIFVEETVYSQTLDYSYVPVHCIRCHQYWHTDVKSSLPFVKQMQRKREIKKSIRANTKGINDRDRKEMVHNLKVAGTVEVMASNSESSG